MEEEARESETDSTEIEPDVEPEIENEAEVEEAEHACIPDTTWCVGNILHSCSTEGAPKEPVDCGSNGSCLPEQAKCRPEWALLFDGSSDSYVTLDSHNLIRKTTTATIEAWIRLSTPTPLPDPQLRDGHAIYTEGLNWVLSFKVYFDGTLAFDEWNPSTGWVRTTSASGEVPSGRWIHVAAVKQPGLRELYVDGRRVALKTVDQPDPAITTDTPSRLGLMTNGAIDELRLSNSARYSAEFIPAYRHEADSKTIALWHLDEGTGTQITDLVLGRIGQLSGGTTWSSGVSAFNH